MYYVNIGLKSKNLCNMFLLVNISNAAAPDIIQALIDDFSIKVICSINPVISGVLVRLALAKASSREWDSLAAELIHKLVSISVVISRRQILTGLIMVAGVTVKAEGTVEPGVGDGSIVSVMFGIAHVF